MCRLMVKPSGSVSAQSRYRKFFSSRRVVILCKSMVVQFLVTQAMAQETLPLYNQNISEMYKTPDGHYRLAEDIDGSLLNVTERPASFTGKLDGYGYAFYGLHLNASELSFKPQGGLFRKVENAKIGNLTFYDSFVSGFEYSGLLAGELINSLVERVRLMNGTVLGLAGDSNTPYAGGIAGRSERSTVQDMDIGINVEGGQGRTGGTGSDGDFLSGTRHGGSGGTGYHGTGAGALSGQSLNSTFHRAVVLGNTTFSAGTGGQGGQGGRGRDENFSVDNDGNLHPIEAGNGGKGGKGGKGGNVGILADSQQDTFSDLILQGSYIVGMAGARGEGGMAGQLGDNVVNGALGALGENGTLIAPASFTMPIINNVYWSEYPVQNHTEAQLKQSNTYENFNRLDWRIQDGYYPYPQALTPVFRPVEPLSYNASGQDFAWPQLNNWLVQSEISFSDQWQTSPVNQWVVVSPNTFGDFLRYADTFEPPLKGPVASTPDELFVQLAPQGLEIKAHRIMPDGEHLILWHPGKQDDACSLTGFTLSPSGQSEELLTSHWSQSLTGKSCIDLITHENHLLLLSGEGLWTLTDNGSESDARFQLQALPLPAGLESPLVLQKVLTLASGRLHLLAKDNNNQPYWLAYQFQDTANNWSLSFNAGLPQQLTVISGAQMGDRLYLLGHSGNNYRLYRSQPEPDSADLSWTEIRNLNGVFNTTKPGALHLTHYHNHLHLAGIDGTEVGWLQITSEGEVVRTAHFAPEYLARPTDLAFSETGGELTLVIAGQGNSQEAALEQLPWTPEQFPFLLTGETVSMLHQHNFTEVFRNPSVRFQLAENIHEVSDANLRPDVFTGSLDGRGYAIYNLNHTSTPPTTGGGLFHRMSNASLGNLTIYDATVSGAPYTGVLASESEFSLFENIRLIGGRVLGWAGH